MPLQNRVTPTGEIIATPDRGLFTGNRGIIHDPATKTLTRRWAGQAWLTCVCEFRGQRRDGAGARRELSDCTGPGAAVVAGRLPRYFERDQGRRRVANTALDVAGAGCGIPASAASKRDELSV